MAMSDAETVSTAISSTAPFRSKECCGTPTLRRRPKTLGREEISTPSTRMLPELRLMMRKRLATREVLPLPVLPQTPIFSPALMSRDTFFRMRLSLLRRRRVVQVSNDFSPNVGDIQADTHL